MAQPRRDGDRVVPVAEGGAARPVAKVMGHEPGGPTRRDSGSLCRPNEHVVEPTGRRRIRSAGHGEHPGCLGANDSSDLRVPILNRSYGSTVEDNGSFVAALGSRTDQDLAVD